MGAQSSRSRQMSNRDLKRNTAATGFPAGFAAAVRRAFVSSSCEPLTLGRDEDAAETPKIPLPAAADSSAPRLQIEPGYVGKSPECLEVCESPKTKESS